MTHKLIPNRERYDFDKFIDSIIELNFHEMFETLNEECRQTEASMTGRGGPQARADGAREYVNRLKRVGFWFHNGTLVPDGREATTCRRIAEKLIARGDLSPKALEVI